jgi:hypothetical protein
MPESFGIPVAYLTIIAFHLRHVPSAIMPLVPIQTGEEVLQTEVVKDNDARMAAAYLPDRAVKKAIVTDVVNAHVATIEFRPSYALRLIAPHFGVVLQIGIPFGLVRPEYDMGPCAKGGEYPRCVGGDPCLSRRQRRKPVQYHASSLSTTWGQKIFWLS